MARARASSCLSSSVTNQFKIRKTERAVGGEGRERQRETDIYIYIYIERKSERERRREEKEEKIKEQESPSSDPSFLEPRGEGSDEIGAEANDSFALATGDVGASLEGNRRCGGCGRTSIFQPTDGFAVYACTCVLRMSAI